MLPDLNDDEIVRYTRHLALPGLGADGQRKLKSASVLVVGAGGLGSPIDIYLAAAGVGHIGIVDSDQVSLSNLQRQVLHDMQAIGKPKVESARSRLLTLNPNIQVDIYPARITSDNIAGIANSYPILADGTDNLASRYVVNQYCVSTGKIYVYGAIYAYEGQLSVFDARSGPCYQCIFRQAPPPVKGEIPVLSTLPGVIGCMQATEIIKIILGLGTPLTGSLLIYDALEQNQQRINIHKNPSCPVCGAGAVN